MRNWKSTVALLIVVCGMLGLMFWSASTTLAYSKNAEMNQNLKKQLNCYDWGDAPDPTYPSLKVNNGPYHITPTFWLGEYVNHETDSRQIDMDNYDDGIKFLGSSPTPGGPYNGTYYKPGEYGAVIVVVSGEYNYNVYVHGWIDWNRDGDWDDAGDNIFSKELISAPRTVVLEFQVPETLVPGDTWARFRVDNDNLNSTTGMAQKGEVEDYHLIDWLVPVELDIFEAMCEDGIAKLYWRTRSETENFGFDVYRSEIADGEYTRITTQPIAAKGTSEQGEEYWFEDASVEEGLIYYYKLSDIDFDGNITFHGPVQVEVIAGPHDYALSRCYPNPFNPETEVEFSVKKDGIVRFTVYDIMGRFVRALFEDNVNPGKYRIRWDGTNATGELASSGTYIIRMTADDYVASRKVIFMK